MSVERISIELTNQCGKKCHFCYNHSHPEGKTNWKADEVIAFVEDCANNGTKAVSFGGGEPLEYPELFTILQTLQGKIFRSVTSNGLLLRGELLEKLQQYLANSHFQNLRFSETETIQPIEHTRCNFWGGTDCWITWIDSEGNRRTNHGREL